MKMKTTIYSLAAATLLGGAVNAQTSTATDPVGFHTLTVYGNGGSGNRFSLVSPGLVNPIEYSSNATAITDDTVTVDGTPFDALDFGPPSTANDGGAGYYVEYVDETDPLAGGSWANIISNTENTLTISRPLAGASPTSKIAIRKHVTIADLFGATNEAGLGSGGTSSAADEITLFSSVTGAKIYFYFSGGGQEGWATSAGQPAANAPIEPQQGVYVKRKQAGDLVFTRAGHVKVGQTQLDVNSGFNVLAIPRAVGADDNGDPVFTLDSSGLHTDVPANSVATGTNPNVADTVTTFLPGGGFGLYFYFEDANQAGWASGAGQPAGGTILDNGTGIVLNRRGNPPFVWTVPEEVIAE